ncbi:MAG: porin [Pseudomonadota bacterium]
MKRFTAGTALVCAALAPVAAVSAPTVYGNIHIVLNKIDSLGEYRMDSHNSAIGIKGSEDLDNGLKFIYKVEFEYDSTVRDDETSSLRDRDQWAGFVSKEYGVLRAGTISTGYKTSGAAVDPLYRTLFEGRGFMNTQSRLHDDAGQPNLGKSESTLRYDSPLIGNVRYIGSYALSKQEKNVWGLSAHFEDAGLKLNLDYLNSDQLNGSAIKLGGQYKTGGFLFGGQYESGDKEIFGDGVSAVYALHGGYISGNNSWIATVGGHKDYSTSWGVMWNHKMSESTDLYAGFALKNYDKAAGLPDDDAFGIGVRHDF